MPAFLVLITALLGFAAIELAYIANEQKTISRRCQEWANANPQLACATTAAAGLIFGWLLAHWTQLPS